jgi:transcriptional regulator
MVAVQHFAQKSVSVMRAYMTENPFAALVVNTTHGPTVDHIPLEFDAGSSSEGRLLGHVARSNPLWREFESGPGLAVFSAHHAYISPDWYASRAADPRVVPTWNYAAVHVSGTLRFFHGADRIQKLLERMTDRFESARPTPWRMTDSPAEYLARLVGGVVGIELEIDSMVGKWKLSQNRPPEDRDGVMAGLRREAGANGAALADLMAKQDAAKE